MSWAGSSILIKWCWSKPINRSILSCCTAC